MTTKILSRTKLLEAVASQKAAGRKVVFANGAFDLLHVGHVRYLQAARREGDWLAVGVNSDRSVARAKGRPGPSCRRPSGWRSWRRSRAWTRWRSSTRTRRPPG